MARKPKKEEIEEAAVSEEASAAENVAPETSDDAAHAEPDAPPVDAIDPLRAVMRAIAIERFGAADEAEIDALIIEQGMGPDDRARARYHRRADENFCHAVENDDRFRAALEAKRG